MDKKKKEAAKTSPIGVRFKKESVERIMKERKIETHQGVLDFLIKLYDDSFHPNQVLLNPVLERNTETYEQRMERQTKFEKSEMARDRMGPKNGDVAKEYGFKPFGAEEVPVIDFGEATFLQTEKFTKYPLYEKPTNRLEAARYMEKKAAYDEGIRIQWLAHKKRKGL